MFLVLRLLPVYEILSNSYKIPGLQFSRKWDIFVEYTLTSFLDVSLNEQLLIVGFSLLIVLNILLFVVFTKRHAKFFHKKSLFASISGMFLGMFGIGCLSCGVLVLAPVLTFLGFGAYLGTLSHYALAVSYIGLGFVTLSSVYLLYKLSRPLVC
ncbi:hypothetical protein KC901_01475 [Patescibacteria group bacterium]|nr:hypothetical protein [Patescibacteria group bacterium]